MNASVNAPLIFPLQSEYDVWFVLSSIKCNKCKWEKKKTRNASQPHIFTIAMCASALGLSFGAAAQNWIGWNWIELKRFETTLSQSKQKRISYVISKLIPIHYLFGFYCDCHDGTVSLHYCCCFCFCFYCVCCVYRCFFCFFLMVGFSNSYSIIFCLRNGQKQIEEINKQRRNEKENGECIDWTICYNIHMYVYFIMCSMQ